MVRQWGGILAVDGSENIGVIDGGGGRSYLTIFLIWLGLMSLCMMASSILSCADGVSKEKTCSADDSTIYSAGCAAGCGAACGA